MEACHQVPKLYLQQHGGYRKYLNIGISGCYASVWSLFLLGSYKTPLLRYSLRQPSNLVLHSRNLRSQNIYKLGQICLTQRDRRLLLLLEPLELEVQLDSVTHVESELLNQTMDQVKNNDLEIFPELEADLRRLHHDPIIYVFHFFLINIKFS